MKRLMSTLFVLVTFSACASLHSEVEDDIQNGDTEQHVADTLGKPAEITPVNSTNNAHELVYESGADTCKLVMENEAVSSKTCTTDPEYRSPASKVLHVFGVILQGMGQGMQNANQNQTHCTTNVYGNTAQTNCY